MLYQLSYIHHHVFERVPAATRLGDSVVAAVEPHRDVPNWRAWRESNPRPTD